MSVTGISIISGAGQQQGIKNADAKLQAAIASIVSGTNSSDVAKVSIASQLQGQTSGLKQLSSALTQGFSLTQVADGGAQQIQNALTQLKTLAQTAQSPTVNADTRNQLDQQFKKILGQVDQIATGTSFNGKKLLDGTLSAANALSLDSLLSTSESGSELSIGNLASNSLLGSVSISSADSAGQAINAISSALNQVAGTRADIGAFQQTLSFATANIETALANQEAAQSSLTDTDFTSATTTSSLADVQKNAALALAAQGNHLTPAILKLVG